MIQEHNQVKQALMNEIRMLRNAMTPQSLQLASDQMKSEEVRRKQEEDMIQAHIDRDQLKVNISFIIIHVKLFILVLGGAWKLG